MRIEHTFLKKYLDEEASYGLTPAVPSSQPQGDPETITRFLRCLAESREEIRAEKRAQGLCLPPADFENLSEHARSLAEIFGMDYLAESSGGCARLTLSGRGIDLCQDEHPELIEALSLLIARADRLFINPAVRYGVPVTELSMLYILSE